MIIILFKKLIAGVLVCATILTGTINYNGAVTITADAASAVTKPQIQLRNNFGDKLEVTIKNLSSYKSNTAFDVYSGNSKVFENLSLKTIKSKNGIISIYHNGKNNLKTNADYSIRLVAKYNNKNSGYSNTLKAKTPSASYYTAKKSAPVYTLKNGKMKKTDNTDSQINVKGSFCDNKGTAVAGKTNATYKGSCIKVLEGKYKGKYVSFSDSKLNRLDVSEYKRRVVCTYAKSMDGGRYVWGGTSYRATDCSGLTMLAYKQIGVNIPHASHAQASVGKAVSRNNMKAGDIIVMNGGGHVAMYLGNNKMVHAMNSYDGIKVQNTSNLQYYSVNTVRRII